MCHAIYKSCVDFIYAVFSTVGLYIFGFFSAAVFFRCSRLCVVFLPISGELDTPRLQDNKPFKVI